ncbi:MAG: zeta toxin family protein [Ruminococcus sp.]|jgi:predicted ABC-type ATPase|nr:zeta toxin family protein [Ruminococcus sp.]
MKELYIFAGPNGSGKSTIIQASIKRSICAGNYICPDNFVATKDKDKFEPYIAAMQKAEAARYQEIALGNSFTIETVLSTPEKLEFIRYAKRQGYKIHTEYVSTNSPEINIARVKERVLHGGHDVPTDKIISRYEKCMQLMFDVVAESDRAYITDNSGGSPFLAAKKSDGKIIVVKSTPWLEKYLISKMPQ